MTPSQMLRFFAAWAVSAIVSGSGCSGPPPGGLEDYQKNIQTGEEALKSQGAKLARKPYVMNQVAWLVDLSGKEIKPETLEAIQKLEAVGELNLSGSTITDEQLQSLGKVSPLYVLNLSKTGITDAGLNRLTHNTIADLDVSETKVTPGAVAALKKRYSTDPAINAFFRNIKIKQ